MKFKLPEYQEQFTKLPYKLQEIALFFEDLSQQFGIEPVCTRCWDPVPGDSGVHEAHRGIDFRDQYEDDHGKLVSLYTAAQMNSIISTINENYPRNDDHLVAIHHSFEGGMFHVHLQIPAEWVMD